MIDLLFLAVFGVLIITIVLFITKRIIDLENTIQLWEKKCRRLEVENENYRIALDRLVNNPDDRVAYFWAKKLLEGEE